MPLMANTAIAISLWVSISLVGFFGWSYAGATMMMVTMYSTASRVTLSGAHETLGHGVKTSVTPRMTAQQPPGREAAARQCTMFLQGFQRKMGAARRKAALAADVWAQAELVAPHK